VAIRKGPKDPNNDCGERSGELEHYRHLPCKVYLTLARST
jgi:hypothetical protein